MVYIRPRAAGIILRNKKLLMLKGKGFPELWTPGGKIEEGESDVECLSRELKEETGMILKSAEFFGEYTNESPYNPWMTRQRVYVVTADGNPVPDDEIEYCIWLSRDDFENGKYPMLKSNIKIINDLIDKNLF